MELDLGFIITLNTLHIILFCTADTTSFKMLLGLSAEFKSNTCAFYVKTLL